jgi:hypothetical protein
MEMVKLSEYLRNEIVPVLKDVQLQLLSYDDASYGSIRQLDERATTRLARKRRELGRP